VPSISHKSACWIAAGACSLLLVSFASTNWLAWQHTSATYDEPLHLVASRIQTELGDFRCDANNPPLWKYYLSVGTDPRDLPLDTTSPEWSAMLSDTAASQTFAVQTLFSPSDTNADALIRAGRARMLILGILLGALIIWWSWRLAGPVAALVAGALFSFDPNFLAHSSLIKNDVPITLLFTALTYAVWRIGRDAGILNCLAVAVLLAAAITTKFSGLLGIPILAACLVARCLIPADWPVFRWTAKTLRDRSLAAAGILIWSLLFSYIFVWACYGFRFDPAPGAKVDLAPAIHYYGWTQTLAANQAVVDTSASQANQWYLDWRPDSLVQLVRWTDRHHFLPATFLRGFLAIEGDFNSRGGFLCGDSRSFGWWYYFPLVVAFKTPLATLLAIALAAIYCAASPPPRTLWPVCAITIAPILYLLFAARSGLDVGVRHILPVYPFLFIFVGVIAARAANRFGKYATALIALLLLGVAVETFAAFPNYIPFFNVAAGGYRGGARLLGDSNIDWGQSLPAVADWQHAHPDYQLLFCYWGSDDPRRFGIHYANLPGSSAPPDQLHPTGQKPYWAISVVALQGQFLSARGRHFYDPFRNRQPTQILGGCVYLYAPW
jgi:hypothetical protein